MCFDIHASDDEMCKSQYQKPVPPRKPRYLNITFITHHLKLSAKVMQ